MTDAPQHIIDNYEQVMPGVFAGVPNQLYHDSDGISKTNICDIERSVAHYLLAKQYPTQQTDAMLKGSALHDLCLLPDFYHSQYRVATVKGKNTKTYQAFVQEHPGKDILTSGMANDVREMRDAVFANDTMREVLEADTAMREVSIWAKDPITGLLLKCRPDMIYNGVIFDLKTTIAPHQRAFIHSVYEYKYQVQAAYYMYIAGLIGMTMDDFIFLVVGNKPPYLTAIYNLNEDLLEEGELFFRNALLRYANYLESDDKWDGLEYGRELITL